MVEVAKYSAVLIVGQVAKHAAIFKNPQKVKIFRFWSNLAGK